MGLFSKIFDDILGFDPNGGGIMPFLGPLGSLAGGLLGGPGGAALGGSLGALGSAFGGVGGFGGGIDPKYLGDYVDELKKQQEAARAANEARYGEIIKNNRGIIRQTKQEGREQMNFLRGQRKEQVQQTKEQFNNLGTRVNQDLVSRGLTNTTIAPTVQTGIEGEKRRAITDVRNTANRSLLATKQYNQGRIDNARYNMVNFKERRTDAYPDLSGLSSLAQAYGQAQGNDRARINAQIQGALQGLGGIFGGQPGQTTWNPYPSGQNQQGSQGGLGSLIGTAAKFLPFFL